MLILSKLELRKLTMKRPDILYRPSDGAEFIKMENGKYVLNIEGSVFQHNYEDLIKVGFVDELKKCKIVKHKCKHCKK